MTAIWNIAKRELNSYFDSLIAYIIIIAFLAFTGIFTWLYGGDVFLRKQADMQVFFSMAQWTLFFFIPAITMRLLSEDKKTGTIELLLTKPISERQIVLGKWLSAFVMVAVALLFTIPYYITIANIGNIDHGATITGYLGLLLLSGAYISIGVFTSSITDNQIVAFLLALFIGIFFQFIFGFLAFNFTGLMGEIFNGLSLSNHFESISRGVVDSKDLIYFFSIILLGILLAEWNIRKMR